MEPNAEACPFEASVRAAHCRSCCDASSVPPCAAQWLRARLELRAVAVLRTVPAQRKAA